MRRPGIDFKLTHRSFMIGWYYNAGPPFLCGGNFMIFLGPLTLSWYW